MAAGRQRGFSLVEIVVVLIVMSIISIGLVQYILDSASGFSRASIRSELSASGRTVIDRIAMDMHNALPNSVRISTAYTSASPEVMAGNAYAGDQCIEFVPILAATTYIDPHFRPQPQTTTFTVVDFVPDQDGASGVYIAIYPRDTDDIYAASFSGTTTEAIAGASVADADPMDGINEITTTTNHRFKRQSPTMRAFLTEQPISFCVKGDRIYRYSNYGFNATQLRPVDIGGGCSAGTCLPSSTPDRELMTAFIDNAALTDGGSQAFDQLAANRRRNAVVQIELNFSKQTGDAVLLNHEVLLHSSP